jgi:hydroxymethylbilane synthase
VKLGTRGSALALWQAHTVAQLVLERTGVTCEIVTIRTSGDERSASIETASAPPDISKRVFVKEIEDALLDGRIDVAVHSAKDMSAVQPKGLAIGAALPREDPRDAIVLPQTMAVQEDLESLLRTLGERPRIGTSSLRRSAQLTRMLPQASFAPVRGNVDTRLRKLDAGECDALVLAVAGLRRLDRSERISFPLPVDLCTPAPGQGIIAVQVRTGDANAGATVARITDQEAADALIAEQALVHALGGGCQLPLGALARLDDDTLVLSAVVVTPDGSRALRDDRTGLRQDAAAIGNALAGALLAAGAGEILGRA